MKILLEVMFLGTLESSLREIQVHKSAAIHYRRIFDAGETKLSCQPLPFAAGDANSPAGTD